MDKYTISLLQGRLGNIMFELAAGLTYAKNTGTEFICLIKEPLLTPYSDYPWIYNKFKPVKMVNLNGEAYKIHKEDQNITPKKIEHFNGHLILDGYFQSEVYIDRDYIKYIFKIDESLKNILLNRYDGISDGVGIHVRRGDYLKLRNIFHVFDGEYYEKLYEKYFKGLKCFIASDDINWCKDNIHIDGSEFIIDDAENTMRTLSLCKHHILSPSSFSWWSAWLEECEDSVNIAPYPWFTKESGLCSELIAPSRWIIEEI